MGLDDTDESLFQSTLPRGERPGQFLRPTTHQKCFNPRSHGGSDHRPRYTQTAIWCFNPRSHGGSDRNYRIPAEETAMRFNPRSHGGSDLAKARQLLFTLQFQSTLPRGERLFYVRHPYTCFKFQSTLPRGERRPRN